MRFRKTEVSTSLTYAKQNEWPEMSERPCWVAAVRARAAKRLLYSVIAGGVAGVHKGGAQRPDSSVRTAQTACWEGRVIHLYFCVRVWKQMSLWSF